MTGDEHDAPNLGAAVVAVADLVGSRPARLGRTRLVAVDGPSGSGKTSFAQPLATAIAEAVGGTVVRPRRLTGTIATDDETPGIPSYPRGERAADRPLVTVISTDLLATWEHPLDWWPIVEEHLLAPIAAGKSATMPVTQWVSGNPRPGGWIAVPPADVIVFEGVSAGRLAVRDRLSALVWVEVPDPAQRLERAVARDGEAMRHHLARWQVTEKAHFDADRTRARADIVIDPTAAAS